MKKPAKKPLTLATETVRTLDDVQLAQVPGGLLRASDLKTDCCKSATCTQ